MKKIIWVYHRFRAMVFPWEIIYRFSQIFKTVNSIKNIPVNEFAPSLNFSRTSATLQINDCILHCKFYDCHHLNYSAIHDWRKDYKNNISSNSGHVFKINTQSFATVGDFRYVCFPSRFHHLPFFAIKGTEDITYASYVINHLASWNEQNPYLHSIHWKSGIEVGIRVTNFIYARKIMALDPIPYQTMLPNFDELIYKHFYFLTKHLSLYSSANNHLIAELLGIYVVAVHYQGKNMQYWKRKAFFWLYDELMKQTHADGFTKEQSAHYHAEVLQMFMIWASLAKEAGLEAPQPALERLRQMVIFLLYLLKPDGHLADMGDSDEGQLIFPYFDPEFSLYPSLLTDWAVLSGEVLTTNLRFDHRNHLIWGDVGHETFNSLPKPHQPFVPNTRFFEDSGYCFIREARYSIWFDVGPLGYGTLAAHGHADLLHFTLDVDGIPFIIDPGTFQYHSRFAKWRNYFRGTTAHNTISVNGQNQALSGGRMIWLKHPKIQDRIYQETDTQIFCKAAHDGFARQGSSCLHKRSFTYHKETMRCIIQDEIIAEKAGSMAFYLHFHPDIVVIHEGPTIQLSHPSGVGLTIENHFFDTAALVKKDEETPLGWFSPKFSQRVPTTTLRLSLPFHQRGFMMETRISLL